MKKYFSLLIIFTLAIVQAEKLSYIATEGTLISVDVSPDGKHLAFDLLGHIYTMSISGGKASAVTKGTSWNMYPRYSPDGKKLMFTSDRSGSDDLWVYDLNSAEMTNVTKMELPVHQGTWSTDGRHVFGTALNMKVRHPVYMFNMYGEKQVIIPAGSRAPVTHFAMHPTNGLIYFAHGDKSPYTSGDRIKTFNMKNGKVEIYIDRPGGAATPTISPDGKKLAYIHRDDRQTVLVIHDLETREEKVISRDLDFDRQDSGSFYGSYTNMSWHPNGQEIFISFRGGIHAVKVRTGKARKIEFSAPVNREIKETVRFKVDVPRSKGTTRSHRWSTKIQGGILYEAMGDLYLKKGSSIRNLTNSKDHETNPVYDPKTKMIYFASWNDKDFGGVYKMSVNNNKREKISSVRSQYGSIALSNKGHVAYIRGGGSLINGNHLEGQNDYKLVLNWNGKETVLTDITWIGNMFAKRPPSVFFGSDDRIYYSDYVSDTLTIKSVTLDGLDEKSVYKFSNATRAIISPNMEWVAFREYHRSFVTPFEYVGNTLIVSAADKKGFTQRVDQKNDGDFMSWSDDSKTLSWTRGRYHFEKSLSDILKENKKLSKSDLSFTYKISKPETVVALTGLRVMTMN